MTRGALAAGWIGLIWFTSVRASEPANAAAPAASPSTDAKFIPYASDPAHLWNRLHQALFVRTFPDGSLRVHSTDPLLYSYGVYLLEGEPHRRAIELLDESLVGNGERLIDDPLKRLFFQRDLWAAFDYWPGVPTIGYITPDTRRRPWRCARDWPR